MTASEGIEIIKNFVISQMDGQEVPHDEAEEVEKLSDAVRLMHQSNEHVHQALGIELLGVVINRVRSSIATRRALQDLGGGSVQ